MINYDNIKEIPLEKALTLYNALKALCDQYEIQLRPLFNATTQSEQKKWLEINGEYQTAKMYMNAILNVMKNNAYNFIETFKPEKPKKTRKKS